MLLHFGHSKESNSRPGLSGSMPNSSIAVPHLEQAGRLIESECGVAGWYVLIRFQTPSVFRAGTRVPRRERRWRTLPPRAIFPQPKLLIFQSDSWGVGRGYL